MIPGLATVWDSVQSHLLWRVSVQLRPKPRGKRNGTDMQEVGALVVNDAIAAAAGPTCALSYINTIVTLLWGQLPVARLLGYQEQGTDSHSCRIPNSSWRRETRHPADHQHSALDCPIGNILVLAKRPWMKGDRSGQAK